MAGVFYKQGLKAVRAVPAQDHHRVSILRKRANGISIPISEIRVVSFGLVVPQVVVLSEVLEGEGFAVVGKRDEGGEEGHVDVDVFADGAVVASGGSGAVD